MNLIMYSLIVGDGTVGPIYLDTSSKFPAKIQLPPETFLQYLPKTRNVNDRRGEKGFLAFLEQNTSDKSLVKGDLLLSDAEKAFNTELVNDLIEHKNLYSIHFPPGMGHLMNPCDQYYHASVKTRYWRFIDELKSVSIESMINCIHKAVKKEKEKSIRNYFRSCGIIDSEKTPEEIMNHLLYQGLSPSEKFKLIHLKQLISLINWKWADHVNTKRRLCQKYEKMYSNFYQ